jgi:hypothetical protein
MAVKSSGSTGRFAVTPEKMQSSSTGTSSEMDNHMLRISSKQQEKMLLLFMRLQKKLWELHEQEQEQEQQEQDHQG